MATTVDQSGLPARPAPAGANEASGASLRIDPNRLFRVHLSIIGALATVHVALLLIAVLTGHDSLMGVNRLFNLNAEGNVPTFFVGLALVAAALVAALLARQARHVAPRLARGWWIVAAILAFLALDDVSQIHETIGGLLRHLAITSSRSSPWIILYAPLAAIVAATCLPLWWRLPGPTRIALAIAGALYVGAELGLEVVQAALVERLGDPALAGQSMAYKILVTLEEVTGMVAVALLLRTLLAHFVSLGGSAEIIWSGSGQRAPNHGNP